MQLKITICFALLEVGSINILIYIKGYLSQQCLKYPTKRRLKIPQSKYPPEGGWLNKPQSILPMKFHAAVKKEECGTCMWVRAMALMGYYVSKSQGAENCV